MKENPVKEILIIDDEKDFCFFTKENLESIGNFKVTVATNGKRGIQLAHQHKPHLILLDLIMPKMDGFQVLERLKKSKNTVSIPIIILTARDDDESKIKAAELFSEDYIVKPAPTEVLSSKIERVLSRFGKD